MKKKLYSLIYYFLHDMKFKNKLLITHLLLILVPTLVVFSFLYGKLSRIITLNTIESEQALVSQTANTLEGNINQLNLAMNTITSNPFLSEAIYAPDTALSDPIESSSDAKRLFADINSLIDHEFITAVKIYLPSGKEDLSNISAFSNISESVDSVKGSYWYGIFAGSPSSVSLLCPSFYLTNSEIKELGDLAYIKKFTSISGPTDDCAYIAIYFSSEYLKNTLQQSLTNISSVYYLVNSRNTIVTASDVALAGTYFMRYENIPQTIDTSQLFTTVKILGEDLYISYRDIAHADWRLVSIIPASSILSEGQQILFNTVLLYLIFVILSCTFSLLLSGNIAKRLSLVVSKMNQYSGKVPVIFENDTDHDEIGQLIHHYNIMVDRINQLINEQTETAEKLKVSEVRALQAQINPHFLYNMLDMINWLAQDGKHREVSIAVQTLSKFYKLTLSKKNITTSVREELKHVELYVKLQNMRYENNISFIIDVPDEVLDYEIPKLVLQPIVENSIQHGIFETESKSGTIVIMAWMENDDIIFVVSDTGVGIPPETLSAILDDSENGNAGSNIGIYNTHLRLQLLYGKDYGLHYESVYGQGTEVQVRIPAVSYPK